ncbi:2-amino-4-hydroxy-6-hydroxymethyldihydropteridine diphosphokinase [Paenibacillus provencensis]|uniref:2-amino-4-hydroxy-6-hydroxymethyldihydropteridine diphosphokinase n=1 Tax=Paenibacillus provencensis TaxID=441151 RepID=A0ABW3QCE2_9BACL|nr:2-amino-4-hydroxy-6-hydroxymethyldihydropteridine diphosphokinase [Paenibacillus sp. MER 78]MCM3130793.1 2-amino-4-hydroxy-6-hydroxymethyldihydropteridine diphosphokinase [Paenibacillus sp. MER 78]
MNAHRTSDPSEAYIALGANLGDREATLLSAIQLLHQQDKVKVLRCSNLYETEPVGYVDQPSFINMAIAVETSLPPNELLVLMLDIEQRLGRVRDIRWGPRTVDLDLLWYEGTEMNTEQLVLPHPRMAERAFVLVPLSDVVSLQSGSIYTFVQTALERLDERDGIQRWKTCNWPDASALSEN